MVKLIRKNTISALLLAVIFALSLTLRVVNLSSYPVGFQIDEASLGYNAYSLLRTGRSESGEFLPLYVSTFGDYNPIGYDYIDIIPVAFLGLSEFATRLPAAIFGAISVLAIFYLVQVLCKDKKLSFISAFLLAISPWHVEMSRASAETLVALFFVILGFGFVLSFINRFNLRNLIIGTVLLFISFFIYPAPRVFVPLFFLVILAYFYKLWWTDKKYRMPLFGSFIFLVVSVALLIFSIPGGTARFRQTSIINFPQTKLVMEEQIREDGVMHTPSFVARIMHNKPLNFSLTFVNNYMEYFSGSYLFISGGRPPLLSIPRMGLVYLIELPFILIGIYKLLISKNKMSKIPILWLLCAPVVAAVTVDDSPNMRRSIMMIPAIEIIAAAGLLTVASWASGIKKNVLGITFKQVLLGVIILLFAFNVFYFLHEYFVHAQVHRTWYRNNGFRQMMNIVNNNYNRYDKIVMTKNGGGYPLVLFFSRYSPLLYQQEGSPKDADFKGFGKYIFAPNDCPSINTSPNIPTRGKILYVDMGTCNPPSKKSGKKYTDIKREDGSLGFRVIY